MRLWVAEQNETDNSVIFRKMYDAAYEFVKPSDIPQLVLLIAEYQYKDAFVADKEINLVAFMTNCMMELEFV